MVNPLVSFQFFNSVIENACVRPVDIELEGLVLTESEVHLPQHSPDNCVPTLLSAKQQLGGLLFLFLFFHFSVGVFRSVTDVG